MDISIVGSRGIPAEYGGFETFAEQLSVRLAQSGYRVGVSCEDIGDTKKYKGVSLFYTPFPPPHSYTLRKVYEIFSDIYFIWKLGRQSKQIYVLGTGAGLFFWLSKFAKKKPRLLVNIDGLEWKREKFNFLEKLLLNASMKCACLFADKIIVDAKSLNKYVSHSQREKCIFIPYGVEVPEPIDWNSQEVTRLLGVEIRPHEFWLAVARLEPENNIHTIVRGYHESNSEKWLVIVGDFTSKTYRREVEELIDGNDRIILAGFIYDQRLLNMLRQHCFGYIHGHSVGGTNPALLEAMSMKNLIIAHDNEFNREVGSSAILYFDSDSILSETIKTLELKSNNYLSLGKKSFNRIISSYLWDEILNKYTALFEHRDRNEGTKKLTEKCLN